MVISWKIPEFLCSSVFKGRLLHHGYLYSVSENMDALDLFLGISSSFQCLLTDQLSSYSYISS